MDYKGSLPYSSNNAKRKIDILGGWVSLKRSPLLSCCDDMYTFSNYREQRLTLSKVGKSKILRQFYVMYCHLSIDGSPKSNKHNEYIRIPKSRESTQLNFKVLSYNIILDPGFTRRGP